LPARKIFKPAIPLKNFLVSFLFIAIISEAFAQQNYFPYYIPDTIPTARLADSCSKRVNNDYKVPEGVSSKYKGSYLDIKKGATEYVKNVIRYTNLADTVLLPYIVSVYNNITEANPALKNYSIVLSDFYMMNAASVGGRVIIFYAPLLSRLENESQVAAVLCHELAHGELNHIQQGLKTKLDAFYDNAYQEELNKTLKEEFNVNEKLNLLSMKYSFSTRFHDRSQEKAADSLGYLYLLKTKYDSKEARTLMNVLKSVDKPPFADSINYAKFFKCPSSLYDFGSIQPYRSGSLFTVTNDNKAHEDSLADSLSTHPDCEKRIAYLDELMKKVPPHAGSNTDTSVFKKIQWAAAMELIMSFHLYEYYDLSLFNALLYLQRYPDNEYLKAMVMLNWYGLYNAMKNHDLADYVSNYSDENLTQLNNLIYLINNLRLSEMAEFGNCFYASNKIDQNEYAIAVNYCSAMLKEDKSNIASLQEQYKSSYKQGRFISLLDLNPKEENKKKKKKH
jgi:predicted Zn-dependent protease